jgi:cytoskeleton protein RodZ
MGNETYVDGGLFREARERAGLSLGELAQALDVREEYLEALERGELGRLIGPSYVQSIAVRYAAGVNLDPEEVLAACDEAPRPQSPPDDGRGAGREHEGRPPRRRIRALRPLLIALLLIGVAAATLAVLQSMSVISLSEALSGSAGRTATTAGVPPTASTTIATSTITTTSTTTTSTTTNSTTTTTSAGSTANTGVSAATTKAGGFTVVFNPSADVWLEITDQKTGRAIFSGIRKAGERLKLPFTSPAKVVVGRPEVLKVSFNGIVVKTPTALVWRLSSAGIAPAQ